MANNDFYAVSVEDSLWSNWASGWLMQQRENWLTDCCWSEFHWQVLLVRCRCPKPGYNNTWIRNMQACGAKWRSRPKKGSLTIQCDELWSFVDHKCNKQWVWLALDSDRREIVGVYIGARDEGAAHQLWKSLPAVYRQCFKSLYRLLGSIRSCFTLEVASRSRQRNWEDKFNPRDSITPCVNGYLDECGKPCRSRSHWRIILGQFGTLFMLTTNHYFCRITNIYT